MNRLVFKNIFASVAAIASLTLGAPRANAGCGPTFCPSYSTCRVAPFDAPNPAFSDLSALFDGIAVGPSKYGSLGWSYTTKIHDGIGKPHPTETISPRFPCSLLKAISVQESVGWHQFCVPTGPTCTGVSQTIISFDCGYGLMQVTSGMTAGATSAYDADRVASDPGYNVSVGSQILAQKWTVTPSVGDNRVDAIEDWYFSVWAYNGLAFKNNPNNPAYATDRPGYRDPGGLSGGEYPYQEIIWGYVRHPIKAPDGTIAYKSWDLSFPTRSEICASCGSPSANISDPSPLHWTDCPGTSVAPTPDAGPTDAAAPDATPSDATTPHDAAVSDASPSADAPGDTPIGDASPIVDAAVEAGADVNSAEFQGSCGCHVVAPRRAVDAKTVAAALTFAALLKRRRRRSRAIA